MPQLTQQLLPLPLLQAVLMLLPPPACFSLQRQLILLRTLF